MAETAAADSGWTCCALQKRFPAVKQRAAAEVWGWGGIAGSPGTCITLLPSHYSWLIFYKMCLFGRALPLTAVWHQARQRPCESCPSAISWELKWQPTSLLSKPIVAEFHFSSKDTCQLSFCLVLTHFALSFFNLMMCWLTEQAELGSDRIQPIGFFFWVKQTMFHTRRHKSHNSFGWIPSKMLNAHILGRLSFNTVTWTFFFPTLGLEDDCLTMFTCY